MMSVSDQADINIKKKHPATLLITTSGGGGHLQAAHAKKQELLAIDPDSVIYEKDIARSAGGSLLGKFMIDCVWNAAQRKGTVIALDLCAYSIPTFDKLFWVSIFFQIFFLLKNKRIERVIDTQPMVTCAILSAVGLYNRLYNKNIIVEKVLTELPTKQSGHYLKPIKKLSDSQRKRIKLLTVSPYIEEPLTEEGFWKKYSGLEKNQVIYEGLPIRPSFKTTKPLSRSHFTLVLTPKTPEEKSFLKKALKRGLAFLSLPPGNIQLSIPQEHFVITLMLGSQPHQQASLDYVAAIANYAELSSEKTLTLFIFCADKKYEKIPLQQRIFSMIETQKTLPKNLTIVPLSSQPDCVIAPLYQRSDVTITKAGGITSMELLSCSKGKNFIHHETSQKRFSKKHSLGMPKWEYGNALYLQQKKGATFVTPFTLCDHLKTKMEDRKNCHQEGPLQTLSNS